MCPRRPDSLAAEANFRARLAQLGATLLEPQWLGAQQKHRVLCNQGHECCPKPASLNRGQGICRACAGQCPAAAEAAFSAKLAEFGATLVGPYVNTKTQVHILCAEGHDIYVTPASARASGHICQTCTGRASTLAGARFAARVAELGAELLEPYVNSATRRHCRCAAGHDCYPLPASVFDGFGVCLTCSEKDPVAARAKFIQRLESLGVELLETRWLGVDTPHRIRCSQGHIGTPRPTNVLRGGGPCKFCTHNGDWDTFYVVASSEAVKFGVTTGDPRPRLRAHARDGLTESLRLIPGLPEGVALDTERAVRATLAMAGEKPLRGREYFDRSCLALILDVADSWLIAPVKAESDAADATVWLQDELFAA